MKYFLICVGIMVFISVGTAEAAMISKVAPNGILFVPASTAEPNSEAQEKHFRILMRNLNRIYIGRQRTVLQSRAILSPVPSRIRGYGMCRRVNLGYGMGYRGDAMKCS